MALDGSRRLLVPPGLVSCAGALLYGLAASQYTLWHFVYAVSTPVLFALSVLLQPCPSLEIVPRPPTTSAISCVLISSAFSHPTLFQWTAILCMCRAVRHSDDACHVVPCSGQGIQCLTPRTFSCRAVLLSGHSVPHTKHFFIRCWSGHAVDDDTSSLVLCATRTPFLSIVLRHSVSHHLCGRTQWTTIPTSDVSVVALSGQRHYHLGCLFGRTQ